VVDGGAIGRVRDGDIIRIDAETGLMDALVDAHEWETREVRMPVFGDVRHGTGRELFGLMRSTSGSAEQGACSLFVEA
jgi:phosphogluconate dehydratase